MWLIFFSPRKCCARESEKVFCRAEIWCKHWFRWFWRFVSWVFAQARKFSDPLYDIVIDELVEYLNVHSLSEKCMCAQSHVREWWSTCQGRDLYLSWCESKLCLLFGQIERALSIFNYWHQTLPAGNDFAQQKQSRRSRIACSQCSAQQNPNVCARKIFHLVSNNSPRHQ